MKTVAEKRFYFDEFEIDAARRVLLKDGKSVALKPKAFDLLLVLVENHGAVLSKNELLDAVWANQFVEEKNLTVHVAALRKIFGESKNENRFIATVPGTGYKFVAELKLPPEDDDGIIESAFVEERDAEAERREDAGTRRRGDTAAKGGLNLTKIPPIAASPRLLVPASLFLLILLIGGYFWLNRQTPANQKISSIAVLPFQFLNAEAGNEGLELGLTESLINRLSGLKNVSIRPVSAVKKYTSENRDLAKIGDELKVDSVLEGYIQKDGERLRLTIRLLDAKNGLTIWNERIDENLTDIFVVEDKIATRITDSLHIVLSEKEKNQLAKIDTGNVEAYKKYLSARRNWNKRTSEGYYESIKFYNQAIDLDPTFALAYAGIADSYLLIGLYGIEPTTDAFPKARAAAEKALEIDVDSAEAEVDLAMIANLYQYDWRNAEAHFRRAVELKPAYSTGHHWFGLFLAMQGRTDEALQHLTRAAELDPLSPSVATDVAFAYYLGNQNDKAIEHLTKLLKSEPDFPNAHNNLGMNYLAVKRFDEALAEFEKAKQLSSGTLGEVEEIWANGFVGNREEARRFLAEIRKNKSLSPFDLAIIHTSLDEKDKAIENLYKAYETKDPQIVPIKVFPPFESLRKEPAYIELLKKMNL